MLFSEKMAAIPQPKRAKLWQEYRTLCTALALKVQLDRQQRAPTQEELAPLKGAAINANRILEEFHMPPSFSPEKEDFFPLLLAELSALRATPSKGD